MLIKNIKTVLIILSFFCSIIYAKEKKYNEKTYIRNEEEAKAAYSLALFYKERALASLSWCKAYNWWFGKEVS